MNDYISRDALLKAFKLNAKCSNKDYQRGMQDAIDWLVPKVIADIPTADVQPVKAGMWEYSEKEYGACAWYFCSFCDEPAEQLYNDEPLLSEFCPHCGTRMTKDGGKNE